MSPTEAQRASAEGAPTHPDLLLPETRSIDEAFMALALEAAARGVGRTAPNPAVGCVLVRDGVVLATGYHRAAGTAHAEVDALAKLGGQADGTTAYVTLEPCNHHGRTGPCTEALLQAGVRRVVAGLVDPNPQVSGAGLARLRAAGVEVVVGVGGEACAELLAPFATWIARARPLVRVKIAATLDGRIATASGESRWLTGEAARTEVHALRDTHDAVLVGGETLRRDDPALTTRHAAFADRPPRNPLRVVVTRGHSLPLDRQLFTDARAPTLVFTGKGLPERDEAALVASGVRVHRFDADEVPLIEALEALGAAGLTSVLVEGGGALVAGLVAARCVDRVRWYLSPSLLGADGAASLGVLAVSRLADRVALSFRDVRRVGHDVCIDAHVCRTE